MMRRCLLTWLKSEVGEAFLPVAVYTRDQRGFRNQKTN